MQIKLSDALYNALKWLSLIALPAAAALYAALAGVWGWGYIKEVTITIASVETFIGALIGVSTASYKAEQEETDDEYDLP